MRQMHQAILTSLLILLLSPILPANDKRDWSNVEHLKPGTRVAIEYWNGSYLGGQIESANDSALVLVGRYPDPHPGLARTIGRDLIWKVHVAPKAPALPNIDKCAIVGAVVGGVAGAAGEAADAKNGKGVAAVFGAGIGALGGYAGGAMACGIVAMAETPVLWAHRSKLVYEGTGPRPPSPLHP
ncbi:MAG TPA: hypothetical protein VIY69_09645 [Candidatus Acidoferrales bacterium]